MAPLTHLPLNALQNFTDPKTGFKYPKGFALGPATIKATLPTMREPTEEEFMENVRNRKEKMKQDIMLALRTVDSLPCTWKRPVKMMRNAGWDATDAEWKDATLELFNAGVVQIQQKQDTGAIYEIWIS